MPEQTPDPLAMLEVIDEARRSAADRQQAALDMLAAAALHAVVAGADLRAVALRCGFDLDAPPMVSSEEGWTFMLTPWSPREVSQVERFAVWLGRSTQALVMGRLGENGVVEEVPDA